jgi:hypothetical protein
MITIHLLKAAAKSARLDEAGLKKRATTRGDAIAEVKPGDAVLGLTSTWAVERFLGSGKGQTKHAPTVDSGKPQQLELLAPPQKKVPARKPTVVDKKPAAKTPTAKTPAKKTPAAKTPVAKKPAAKSPPAKAPAAKKPASKK